MAKKYSSLPEGVSEEEVKAKLAESFHQLSRDQAITVILQQKQHDAAMAAEAKKKRR